MKDLEALYKERKDSYVKKTYSHIHNYALAEDLVQDAFVRAVAEYGKFDKSRGALSGWFYFILLNTISRYFKKNRLMTISLDHLTHEPINLVDEERKFLKEQNLNQLLDLMSNERNIRIVTLYYIKGYTTTEISKLLSVNVSVVKKVCSGFRKLYKENS